MTSQSIILDMCVHSGPEDEILCKQQLDLQDALGITCTFRNTDIKVLKEDALVGCQWKWKIFFYSL